jgi:2'-5' RNA ligase
VPDSGVNGAEMPDHVLMQMYASLVPPRSVRDDLAAVVRSVRGGDAELDPVPADLLHLPLGYFGNVGLADRLALHTALQQEAAGWAPLELRFRGGSALVSAGDDAVWAHLEGDLAQLTAMGTLIPRVVHRLGFLIDRRTFVTRVRVGRITPTTSVDYLERLLSRLQGYSGPAWTAHHVALLRRLSASDEAAGFDVLHELALTGDQPVGSL